MGKTSNDAQPAGSLAAYWNASALPATPVFLRELIGAAKHHLHVSKIVAFGSRVRAD